MRTSIVLLFFISISAISAREITFSEHEISEEGLGNPGIYSSDLDNDGDIDIIASQSDPPAVKWWRNDGGMPIVWTEFTIAELPGFYIHARDMNNDGKEDVLATMTTGEIICWLNYGIDQPVWNMITVATGFSSPHGIYTTDLDNDGDMDVLATSAGLGKICWWEQETGSWTEHLIGDNFAYTQSVHAADIDNDGDQDVAGVSGGSNSIKVWYNNGAYPITWTEQIITDNFEMAHWIYLCDLDNDNLTDILAAAAGDNEISWWQNNGGSPVGWTKLVIDNGVYCAVTVTAADLDNDNDEDVIATAWWSDDIFWWENDGQETIGWTRHTIDSFNNGVWPIATGDLDNDNDLDIITGADVLTSGGSSAALTWWENSLSVSVEDELINNSSQGSLHFYPNPFEYETRIIFSNSDHKISKLDIYNIRGQKVKTIINKCSGDGKYPAIWAGTDNSGNMLDSGLYLSILRCEGEIISAGKCLIIR